MNKNDVELKIDWASHEAARYACEHWHYSKCIPKSKLAKIGVWEDGKFIGVVIFGVGANNNMLKPFGYNSDEGCELVRVALRNHNNYVTRIISLSIKFLKNNMPKLKMIVSYADPNEGHIGGIYQGGNWIYTGVTDNSKFPIINGKVTHPRTLSLMVKSGKIKSRSEIEYVDKIGKYRYIMPLYKDVRKGLLKYSKPYPKKTCPIGVTGNTSDSQSEDSGSNPTVGLNSKITNG